MKQDEAKQLIRECLNEIFQLQDGSNAKLKLLGKQIERRLTSYGIKVEKWNIKERDKRTVLFQLSFKLLKYSTLKRLISIVETYGEEMRMYPGDYAIGMDIIINKDKMFDDIRR